MSYCAIGAVAGVLVSAAWAYPGDPPRKLTAGDGAPNDAFGYAASVSGHRAVVGAPGDDSPQADCGSAYVFELSGGAWVQAAKLLASDRAGGDAFGRTAAMDGDLAVIGAPYDDDRGQDSGSAYIFERVAGVWTQVAKLTASDGAAYDGFGSAVAISAQSVLVGAPYDDAVGHDSGSAYVFVRVGGVWVQQAKLLGGDGAADDYFGFGVGLSGDLAVIGAPYDDIGGVDSGSAYVFARVGGVWGQSAKLAPAFGAAEDYFGRSVGMDGDFVIAGAHQDDTLGENAGCGYIFERDGGAWVERAKLLPSGGTSWDSIGVSVGLGDGVAVLGAPNASVRATFDGAIHVFERTSGGWGEVGMLSTPDGGAFDYLGFTASTADGDILGGAWGDDDLGLDAGAAYVFEGLGAPCGADFNGDGAVDTRDVLGFLNAWAAGGTSADCDANGVIDTRDVLCFLNLWAAGC